MAKNNITTAGYFIKRLRDNGFYVCRIFDEYGIGDPRNWTTLINPGRESVYITYYTNKNSFQESLFEFNDGGLRFPRNFQLKTESMEVIISYLLRKGISNATKKTQT
jgi:hypothetical protein